VCLGGLDLHWSATSLVPRRRVLIAMAYPNKAPTHKKATKHHYDVLQAWVSEGGGVQAGCDGLVARGGSHLKCVRPSQW